MVKGGEVAIAPVESVALMVKVNDPREECVPEIGTEFVVLGARDNPPGSAPEATDHVNGGTPPDALTVPLYGLLVAPEGREVVVIVGGGSTVIESVADWPGVLTEVAFTITVVAIRTVGGALYVAVILLVGPRVPEPVGGLRLQFTPAFEVSFKTVAVMLSVRPWPMV